jgi:hypothetical protein
MSFARRLVSIAFLAGLIGLAGSRFTAPVSRADTAGAPAATPTATIGPVPEDPCPHITGMTLSVLSSGSLHAGTTVHDRQLLHVAVEWKLNDPQASPLQPSTLVVGQRGHKLYAGWVDELYPHAAADIVIEGAKVHGPARVTVQLGTPPCSSSMAQTVRLMRGSPPRKPWVYPDCLTTYTSAGAGCWLIAGGFKPHEPITVSYTLQPGGGGHAFRGGFRGQADGHGIFGSIALDLGPDVTWHTAVLHITVTDRNHHRVQAQVPLAR